MNFKLRFGTTFITQIVVISSFLLVTLMDIFEPVYKDGLLHYKYILSFLIVVLLLFQCYRHIYAAVFNKNVLSVNENYIYDFLGDVKYYWKDIDEIYDKHSILFIKLHNPSSYINKFGNPFRRFKARLWFKPNEKAPSFTINIDTIAADPDDLLEILNEYSTKA